MANLSAIKLPNGTTYNLKDNSESKSNHLHDSTAFIPLISKTYDAYTVSANDANNGIIFFGNVTIDNTTNYYETWSVKYRLTITTTENATQGVYNCFFAVNGSTVNYAVFNEFYSTSYRPIYNHGLLYPKSGHSGDGAILGIRIYSARTPTTLARTIKVEILETKGCSVTLRDSLDKYSSLYNSTKFYYGEYNATSTGLQESGDVDSGQYYLRYYSLKAESAIVAGNLIVGTDAGYKHLKLGTAFDIKYPILYASSAISAGSTGSNNYIFHYAIGISTTQSLTLTAYQPLYIKGTLSNTTFTPVSTTPITQTLPTSEDGYVYYYIGRSYDTASFTFDGTGRNIYWYKNGAIRLYGGDAATINGKNATGNNTTGISIAAHGTGTVIGVQSSTTTASKVTVGSSLTDYGVKSTGSASTWAFTAKTVVTDITFAMDTTDTKKLKITKTTDTVYSKSSGANSTAPTLGSKVPTVSVSDVTVPIKNASASTFVTGTTHTITDNGHTHSI